VIDADSRLLTDENLHPGVVSFLRENGCDILDVKEEELSGTSDEALVRHAEEESRIIVTHDRDFGRLLIAQGTLSVGVIYLRPGHINPEFTIGTLRVLSTYERPARPFVVVAERQKQNVQVRIREIG
jgi:predicted nuclease of predicted toxin-antitoxin system